MEGITRLAPVGVSAMIMFVAYGCQILFRYIEPGPLDWEQLMWLNGLVAATWVCLARSIFVEPGRVPTGWKPRAAKSESQDRTAATSRSRWCKRCEAPKPPRAHHCKTCKRCVPKMDHHCPWTANCVSNRTLPHFMRMLCYATVSMIYIEYLVYIRVAIVWGKRRLPSYLGPSPLQMVVLFVIFVSNSLILFAVGVLFLRSLWSLAMNVTTIESWEIERHGALVRRAKVLGGYLHGPDGTRIRIFKQEFPYDIGILSNIVQALGWNPLAWLWPFSGSPGLHEGLEFEINDFEDASTTWPPPDPDRMIRRPAAETSGFTYPSDVTDAKRLSSFKLRQAADSFRANGSTQRRRPFHERFDDDESAETLPPETVEGEGEEAWRSSEGERLRDFGLDEDAEFYDEDEVPLAQLIKQKHLATR